MQRSSSTRSVSLDSLDADIYASEGSSSRGPLRNLSFATNLSSRGSSRLSSHSAASRGSENIWTMELEEDETLKKDDRTLFASYFLRILPIRLEKAFWSSDNQMTILRVYWVYFLLADVLSFYTVANVISVVNLVLVLLLVASSCAIFYHSWEATFNSIIYILGLTSILTLVWLFYAAQLYDIRAKTQLWGWFVLQVIGTMMILGSIPMWIQFPLGFVGLCYVAYGTSSRIETDAMIANIISSFVLLMIICVQILRETELTRKQEFLFDVRIRENNQKLVEQRLKSEELLSNILPETVSLRLKRKRVMDQIEKGEGVMVSENFRNMSILFADIVGFTDLSSRHTPEDIVGILNQLFSSFDQLCFKYGVEKLKTIGDAYVAVCGLPIKDAEHARAVVEMALDMVKDPILADNVLGEKLQIRVGVASGRVIAGVIGAHRWAYDVYGPPVHEAEMEEAAAPPLRVRIALSTWLSLSNQNDFIIEEIPDSAESFLISRRDDVAPWYNEKKINDKFEPNQSVNVTNALDVKFQSESQIGKWTLNFLNQKTKKAFWSWKQNRLPSSIKPHLIVGFVILLLFFIQDVVSYNKLSLAASLLFYPITLLFTVVAFFTYPRLIKSERVLGWASLGYYILYIAACHATTFAPDPVRMLPRIELYMAWICCSPVITFWGFFIASLFQYWFYILINLGFGVVNDPVLFVRVPVLLWIAKYILTKSEKRTYVNTRMNEIKGMIVKKEQERSQALLLNILPEHNIRDLKENTSFIAKSYPEVSCMFVKLLGVDPDSSPTELTSLLNGVFSQWDVITRSLGLEKIKTIGVSYLVIGGEEGQRNHLQNMAYLAFKIRESMKELSERYATDLKVSMGISVGPCVGGVVGTKRFCYDVWGDTINYASRMQSNGEENKIQVTSEVAKQLQYDGSFKVESRGIRVIKGKGQVETFWLSPSVQRT